LSIACRGAKTLAEVSRYGLRPTITTAATHTTTDLLRALSSVQVSGRGVVLVHYGERNAVIADALVARGARLKEICPYERALTEDLGPVTRVVREAIAHRLDAMLFTNQVQCRHLFDIATRMSQAEGLALSLNRHVVVGAVGPVCARGLVQAGVTADVVPASASMTALVSAVAAYFTSCRSDITL
jgi:uroporphyrinogen-III synthase